VKLSRTFANSPSVKKFVDDEHVLAYIVVPGGRGGGARVWPVFRGEFHVKVRQRKKEVLHVLNTYDQGMPLNGQYFEDTTGNRLATIASQAIEALQERADLANKTKRKKKASKRS
jgi:hypothetical protein